MESKRIFARVLREIISLQKQVGLKLPFHCYGKRCKKTDKGKNNIEICTKGHALFIFQYVCM